MYHPRLSGTYYEMGHKYGTILRKHGFTLPEQSLEKIEFGRASEPEVKRAFPEVLEEIHGLADACRVSYDNLASFIIGIGAFKPACSAFAAVAGSEVMFGRNYDFYYRFKRYSESYLTRPDDGYSSIGDSDIFVGREDGVNKKGLAVAITFVGTKIVKPGINFALATRCILDKCANVHEAVELLSNAHFSTANSYLLADKERNLAVVEAHPERIAVRHPDGEEKFIVATNHFVHPEMLEMEDMEQRDPTSLTRFSAISSAFKKRKGAIKIRDARQILSNHDGYVCSHRDEIQLGTIWSVIATLNRLKLLVAEGHPCKTGYKEDKRLKKAR